MVEKIRDELRMLTPALTPSERAKRERIVELWENDELTSLELAKCTLAIWVDDWPDDGLVRFVRKIYLEDVPFADAFQQVDEQTRELIAATWSHGRQMFGDDE
jgi:hypothetical protein